MPHWRGAQVRLISMAPDAVVRLHPLLDRIGPLQPAAGGPPPGGRAHRGRRVSRRVLVTGVGGFIGRRMAERLRDRGDAVVGLDRVASPAAEAVCLESGGRLVLGDACDVEDVRAAAAGCDLVVHTAAIVAEAGDWREFIRVNAHSVRSVAQACRAEGVPELVHLSSVMVHGFDYPEDVDEDDWIRGDGNAYCWSKIVSEQHALAAHEPGVLDVYLVRPGDVYGPGSVPWTVRPVQHLRRRVFTHVDPARAVLNHVYVDNLLDGIDLLLERRASGRAFHVTDGARTLQRDFFAYYQRMLGQRLVPSTPYPGGAGGLAAGAVAAAAGAGLPRPAAGRGARDRPHRPLQRRADPRAGIRSGRRPGRGDGPHRGVVAGQRVARLTAQRRRRPRPDGAAPAPATMTCGSGSRSAASGSA